MAPKPWLAAERILFDPLRQREFTVTEHFRIYESRLATNPNPLIDLEKGEHKAQSCDIACYQELTKSVPVTNAPSLSLQSCRAG